MYPHDFPSAADYAQDSANEAQKHVADLQKEVDDLKKRVVSLENTVGQLLYRLDHMQAISDRDRMAH